MKRMPIVLAATAAGLATVLGFHTQQMRTQASSPVLASRATGITPTTSPSGPRSLDVDAGGSSTAGSSSSTACRLRPPSGHRSGSRRRRAVPATGELESGDRYRGRDHKRPAGDRHRLRRPLEPDQRLRGAPPRRARPCRPRAPISTVSPARRTRARPTCSRCRRRWTSSGVK